MQPATVPAQQATNILRSSVAERLCCRLHDLCAEAFGYTDACCEELSVILCYLLRRDALDASIESGYYAYTDPHSPRAGQQIGDHQHVVLGGVRYDPTRDQFMDGQPLISPHQGPDEFYIEEFRFSFAHLNGPTETPPGCSCPSAAADWTATGSRGSASRSDARRSPRAPTSLTPDTHPDGSPGSSASKVVAVALLAADLMSAPSRKPRISCSHEFFQRAGADGHDRSA